MVVITRSAYRKTSESRDSSDVSQKISIPPWCSSGKLCENRKPIKLTPSWEIRTSYPLRENIWDVLHEDRDRRFNCTNKRTKRVRSKQVNKKGGGSSVTTVLTISIIILGIAIWIWFSFLPNTDLSYIIPKRKLISLLGIEHSTSIVGEECCHRMRHLAAALSRAEQALRNTRRLRRNMLLSAPTTTTDIADYSPQEGYIRDALVLKGSDTKEWGGQIALWGIVPLWRAAPPLNTILSLRYPTPADCWPFRGSSGKIIIELPHRYRIRSLSIEHVRPDTARSAPRDFILYGVLENGTWIKAVESIFRNEGPATQRYPLLKLNALKTLVFKVLSNQGNSKYTCVYRVHLYGTFVDDGANIIL